MRYKVVLVPFPFDDLSGQKVRPAVCLTDPVGAYKHVVLAFISSTIPSVVESTDILLDPATFLFPEERKRFQPRAFGKLIQHFF